MFSIEIDTKGNKTKNSAKKEKVYRTKGYLRFHKHTKLIQIRSLQTSENF